jgi:hypothetical protein
VYERYGGSDAAAGHLRTFTATFGERYASMVDRKHFAVSAIPVTSCGRYWTDTEQRITGHLVGFPIGADRASCMRPTYLDAWQGPP